MNTSRLSFEMNIHIRKHPFILDKNLG